MNPSVDLIRNLIMESVFHEKPTSVGVLRGIIEEVLAEQGPPGLSTWWDKLSPERKKELIRKHGRPQAQTATKGIPPEGSETAELPQFRPGGPLDPAKKVPTQPRSSAKMPLPPGVDPAAQTLELPAYAPGSRRAAPPVIRRGFELPGMKKDFWPEDSIVSPKMTDPLDPQARGLQLLGIEDADLAKRYVAGIEQKVRRAAEGGGLGPAGQQDKELIALYDQVNNALPLFRGTPQDPQATIPGTEEAISKLHMLGQEIKHYLTKALGLSWRDIEKESKSKITKAIARRFVAAEPGREKLSRRAALQPRTQPAKRPKSVGVAKTAKMPRLRRESKLNEIIDEVINEMVKHTK